MMVNSDRNDIFIGCITPSYDLFVKMKCTSGYLSKNSTKPRTLDTLDEDKMRCHILDCLVALRRVEKLKKYEEIRYRHECTKRRIFAAAILVIIDDERPTEQHIVTSLLVSFPDRAKMTDGRSWLPLHIAIALGNNICETDVKILYSIDPLAMRRYNHKNCDVEKYTPGHFLCMQKHPSISLIRYLSMRDLIAFSMLTYNSGYSIGYEGVRNNLQLASKYSENAELLKILLQIDHSMIKGIDSNYRSVFYGASLVLHPFFYHRNHHYYHAFYNDFRLYHFIAITNISDNNRSVTPLGYLCRRSTSIFPSFNEMLECLIAADSSNEVVRDGLMSCFISYGESDFIDVKAAVLFIEQLLELIEVKKILSIKIMSYIQYLACTHLKGELCVAVLSLLLTKYGAEAMAGLRVHDSEGKLPIHCAAERSTVDVLRFLLEAYPESLLEVTEDEDNLLHMVLSDCRRDKVRVNAKVQYLCQKCPGLLDMRNSRSESPFQTFICNYSMDINAMKIMFETNKAIVSEKFILIIDDDDYGDHDSDDSDDDDDEEEIFPLALLCRCHHLKSEVSVETSCFLFLLRLFPAAATLLDSEGDSPYQKATRGELPGFIIRLILNADKTIDPQKYRDLNYKARKEGMFLAFRALANDGEPTIWIKLRHESLDLLMHTISYL